MVHPCSQGLPEMVEAEAQAKRARGGRMQGCTTRFYPSASAMTDDVRRLKVTPTTELWTG